MAETEVARAPVERRPTVEPTAPGQTASAQATAETMRVQLSISAAAMASGSPWATADRPLVMADRGSRMRLLASLQTSAGNRATRRLLPGRVVQRQGDDEETDIQRLNDMLGGFDVPESEVIQLIGSMSPADKQTVATNTYRGQIASALDFDEMMQVVTVLPLTLAQKLEWLNASATLTSAIGYSEISALITAASQPDRDALKTDAWKSFFVDVCDNATMVTAVTDLGFDLITKLTWLQAEMTVTSWELDYPTIQPWITAASQPDRDALKTDAWKSFFVDVCDNATMVTAVTDLGFGLKDKLRWLIAEDCNYESFRDVIVPAADKAAVLADSAFLLELKDHFFTWDSFAKCVELLGRAIPGPGALIGDPSVQGALAGAWAASGASIVPAPPAPAPPGVHEEGGFIYLDIVTNAISTDRVAAGAQASLPLNSPNPPANAITVGGYHTHPNVGPAWGAPFASPADVSWASRNGIPLLLRGAFPTVAATSDASTGVARQHLAGDTGFPGASGGVAPQATLDRDFDEL